MLRTAICPGTYDPITFGHLDIIKRAAAIFDRVVVGVDAKNSGKVYLKLETRMELIRSACGHLSNVTVKSYRGLMVDFAKQEGATVIVKGLSAIFDFEKEMQIALVNKKLAGDIETLFLMPSAEYSFFNSYLIHRVARKGGRLKGLVTPQVENVLYQQYQHSGNTEAVL